jgi:uncharacterized protein YcfJ
MRKFLCLAVLLVVPVSFAAAQTETVVQTSGWAAVQALPSGVGLHVSSRSHGSNCIFKSATVDALTCVSTNGQTTNVYPKAEIRSVKLRHRGRSTLAGLAIGIGGGALIGASLGRSGSFVGHGTAATIVAIPGAIIGAIVGASTDFTHSTIYKAP